jgi:hypothetical protein
MTFIVIARASRPNKQQAARGSQRGVHGVEQRQIAQLGTTIKVAQRKIVAPHHHDIGWTSGLQAQNLLDFAHK